MQARILSIQFRKKETSIRLEQESVVREIGTSATVDFISALDTAIDWNSPEALLHGYHGVILGGSGDFDFDGGRPDHDEDKRISYELLNRLRPLISHIFETDTPTLGICYGHQLLGAFAGAQVVNDHTQKKSRSHEVKLLLEHQGHFLFTEVPESFLAHYGHKDSLDRIPDGAVLLAEGGPECRVSALRYKNNIYSTQFHPELTVEDMVKRMRHSPGYLPEGVAVEELFKDDPSSNRILRNFGKLVAAQLHEGGVSV